MGIRIQLRRGTALEWSASNPTLAEGEQGLETDTNKIKIGNGTSPWNSLPYLIDVAEDLPINEIKGALLVGTTTGTASLTVGSTGQVLQPDSSTVTGLKYAKILGSNIDTTTTITTSGFYHSTGNRETWYGGAFLSTAIPAANTFPTNALIVVY